jgi:sugar phosphate isomerase/epimerase
MKLGFVSAILAELSFEEVIDFASDNGFKCVEIMCWPVGKAERRYGGVTHIDMTKINKEKANQILDYCEKKNISISAVSYYPNNMDPDTKKRQFYNEHLKKVIAGANLLGLHNVNTFIGRDKNKNLSESLSDFKKIWPDIVKYAEDNDVTIGIESCPMYFTEDEWPGGKNLAGSPKIWRELFGIIDSKNFGLNYDPSHLVWQNMDYIRSIYEFKDKIVHAHIKDAHLYQDKLNEVGVMATPLEYHAPKIPGHGDVNWGRYIMALRDIKFKGSVCIEVEDYSYEDTLEDKKLALIQSKVFMNQYIL